MTTLLLDTGPLVGWLDASDHLHPWCVETFAGFGSPLVTCEAVLTEACYLLRATHNAPDRILEMVQLGGIVVQSLMPEEVSAVRVLLRQYEDQEMDFADACLVRLSELHPHSRVITADVQDFRVYRRNGRQTIPLITPPAGPWKQQMS